MKGLGSLTLRWTQSQTTLVVVAFVRSFVRYASVMLRLPTGRRRVTARTVVTCARAAFGFVAYARGVVPDPVDALLEERVVGEKMRVVHEDDDDDAGGERAMEIDTDNDDCGDGGLPALTFNDGSLGVVRRRRQRGRDGTGTGAGGHRLTLKEKRRKRGIEELASALDEAFDSKVFRKLRPVAVVMALGSVPGRPREVFELDLRSVEYEDDENEDEANQRENDAFGRRAIRTFVPLAAECPPPRTAGVRAFFFVKARPVMDAASSLGYAPKRSISMDGFRRRVERHSVRVYAANEEGDAMDDEIDVAKLDDGLIWYQAERCVRAFA